MIKRSQKVLVIAVEIMVVKIVNVVVLKILAIQIRCRHLFLEYLLENRFVKIVVLIPEHLAGNIPVVNVLNPLVIINVPDVIVSIVETVIIMLRFAFIVYLYFY